jgi:8-oxo-dGTP pyrophosphatase MutT (NUDIX family)
MPKDTQFLENPWKTLSSKSVYENNWINVVHHNVINPAGNEGVYGTVHFKNIAVGIIVLDENQNTYLVGQYRYPLKTYSWEIPEGGAPFGLNPLEMAKKELKEETGISANNWLVLGVLHTSNSATDEKAILYLATDIEHGEASPEETEDLRLMKLPFVEFIKMIDSGEITDAITVCAGLKLEKMLSKI